MFTTLIWVLGLISLAKFLFTAGSFIYLHFIKPKTDLSKYGGNPNAPECWALVTGCGEGLGNGFAHYLAAAGFNLILLEINQKSLQALTEDLKEKYPKVQTRQLNVDASSNTPELYQQLEDSVKDIDLTIAINNAAVMRVKPFDDTTEKDIQLMLFLHNVFVTQATRILMPHLKKSKKNGARSALVVIGSQSADIPSPLISVYVATKAYLRGFMNCLRSEHIYRNIPVDVVLFEPWGMATRMARAQVKEDGLSGSFFMPNGRTYAAACLDKLDAGSEISAYWPHMPQVQLIRALPHSVQGKVFGDQLSLVLEADRSLLADKKKL